MPEDRPPKFWLKAGDVPTGPFPVDEIHARLAAGAVSWDTPACPVGGGTWVPLCRTPSVGPTDPPLPEPPVPTPAAAPAPADDLARPARPRAWNPAVIAGLSLLFTPLWGGVLGAVNAGRLGLAGRWWPPLAVAVGTLAVGEVPGLFVKYPPYWLDLTLYLAGVAVLWGWGLTGQAEAFREKVGPAAGSTAGWAWPVGLGSPFALLVLVAFVVLPLLPYEPREVCVRLVESASASEAKRYATANLHPALDALFRQKQDDGGEYLFELTDEAPAHPDVGGYLIGYRLLATEKGKTERMEGAFHLVDFGQGWKVEDWLVTAFDGQAIEPPASFARDYERMFQSDIPPPSRPRPGPPPATPSGAATADAGKSWWERNKTWLRLAAGAAAFGSWAGNPGRFAGPQRGGQVVSDSWYVARGGRRARSRSPTCGRCWPTGGSGRTRWYGAGMAIG